MMAGAFLFINELKRKQCSQNTVFTLLFHPEKKPFVIHYVNPSLKKIDYLFRRKPEKICPKKVLGY